MPRTPSCVAACLIAAVLGPGLSPARAQVAITGGEMTNLCTAAAKSGQRRREAIHVCTVAIEHEVVLGRNLAGVYVNRGVLQLRERDYLNARKDFDTALSIDPTLGEAWVDCGAGNIAQRRWGDGVTDIDHGLSLGSQEPEKAYFNRAIAREHLDDIKGAYLDYGKAAELAPTWDAPKEELKRFTVRPSRRRDAESWTSLELELSRRDPRFQGGVEGSVAHTRLFEIKRFLDLFRIEPVFHKIHLPVLESARRLEFSL
jgi:tetratricopeptide (TPR) repeat protein